MRYIVIAFILTLALYGCTNQITGNNEPLYNQTLNQQIENLTGQPLVNSTFELVPHPNATYEISIDDVFTMSNANFTSEQIGILGVKLGDTREFVIGKLGTPDVQYTPPDKSFTNLEFRKAIGIEGMDPGITYQIINGTVQRIMVRSPFTPYLHGNTTLGQSREYLYEVFDTPDYQDFTRYNEGFNYRIFFYVEKGVEFYLRQNEVEMMAFVPSREFNGVEWVTRQINLSEHIVGNITEPRLK